jgi:predicted XRE-type DNA-binding protein
MKDSTFISVWDGLEDDPAERTDLKARSDAMMQLKEHIA